MPNLATNKLNKVKSVSPDRVEKQYQRSIKSFVCHHGRLTAGQRDAIEYSWKDYGIDNIDGLVDIARFGNFSRVVFELGFGNGESFIAMAEAMPSTLFIGAEVHRPGVGRALMLAVEKGLKNVRVLDFDAVQFLQNRLADSCLDRVQIFFPDPWHKKRHFKRRLIQADFCATLHRVLKPNGQIHIATDWVPYAEHCIEIITPLEYLRNTASKGDYVKKPDYRPETKFERRGLKLGHEVRDMIFTNVK